MAPDAVLGIALDMFAVVSGGFKSLRDDEVLP